MSCTECLSDGRLHIVFRFPRQPYPLLAIDSHLDEEQYSLVFIDIWTPLSDAKSIFEYMREKLLEYGIDFTRAETHAGGIENTVTKIVIPKFKGVWLEVDELE